MAFSSAALQKLGDLLSSHHFHIPDYQRGYAWGTSQLNMLWSDLRVAVNSAAKDHFTGIVLLRQLPSDGRIPRVELVDGQQRVISTMTLAHALARRISELAGRATTAASAYRMHFAANDEMQAYFNFWALGDERESARLTPDCSSYAANVKHAALHFRDLASQLDDEKTARAFLDTLLNRFSLFVLDVQPEFDIHVAFETLNNRGKKLSQLELLKNRLIYLSNVLPPGSQDRDASGLAPADEGAALREEIHHVWKRIYRSLGRSEATQNHDDEFLRAHSIAYFGEVREAEWLDKVLFIKTFATTNESLDLQYIASYIRDLERAALWWSHLHEPGFMPARHAMLLGRLERVGHAYFKPLLLAAYMRIAGSNAEAIGMPREHESLLAPVAGLLVEVERFIVLVFTLANRPSHLGRADMNRLARSLLRPDAENCQWKSYGLPGMSAAKAIDFAAGYIRAYTDNRELSPGTWSDPRFEWAGAFSASSVVQEVANRVRREAGYYGWSFTKVVLLEYEESLRQAGHRPIALHWDWEAFSFDETVEHILPQTSDKGGYWNSVFPVDGRQKGLRHAVIHSLGNLLLLSTKANSSLANLPYRAPARGERCKRDLYSRGSHSETQVAHVFNLDWNVASIAARGVAMLKFAEKRWDFNFTDNPEDHASYLPVLFGDRAEDVRNGRASSAQTRVDNRVLNRLVNTLLS